VQAIGHQAVGVHLALELGGKLLQSVQVARVVFIGEEENATIVAALIDVHGHTADHYACAARHGRGAQSAVHSMTSLAENAGKRGPLLL
jgi:hypothetical protein